MRERCRSVGTACALVVSLAAPIADASSDQRTVPRPEDYAYAWPIRAEATYDLYEVELPADVYRAAVDPSLRDLGIFDASGRPVPRLVSSPPAPPAEPDTAVPLALLPVRAPAGTSLADVRFTLEQRTGETRVRVVGASPTGVDQPLVLVAYIADLGDKHPRLRAVDVGWPAALEPLMATITIEGSTDLDRWIPIGRGAVAGLRQDAASIERRRIAVNETGIRYLRLTWLGAPQGFELTRLTAAYSRLPPEPRRDWESPAPAGIDAADGGFLYDLGGAPTVDRAAISLGDANVLLRASLDCRMSARDPWMRAYDGLFYELRRGANALTSEPAELSPRRCQYWKLRAARADQASHPALRLGWRPDRVMFAAEGAGPWRLAAGSARDVADGFPQERYADAGMRELATKAAFGTAALGSREELGGELALEPPRNPDWRRWTLWFGLVAGVLLVAGMAFRLARGGGAAGAA
jgi:uncharacterized protein DUF3999